VEAMLVDFDQFIDLSQKHRSMKTVPVEFNDCSQRLPTSPEDDVRLFSLPIVGSRYDAQFSLRDSKADQDSAVAQFTSPRKEGL
jgi:hypothetical protein